MSIRNITHAPDEVLFVCDKEATAPGGVRKYATKLYPLTHVNGMLAGTGESTVVMALHAAALAAAAEQPTFDAMIEAFPGTARKSMKVVTLFGFRSFQQTWVALAGWSDSRGRMACFDFDANNGFEAQEIEEATLIAPTFPEFGDVYAATMKELIEVARRQRPIAKERFGEAFAAGADLVCARLARDHMSIWQEPAEEPTTFAGVRIGSVVMRA